MIWDTAAFWKCLALFPLAVLFVWVSCRIGLVIEYLTERGLMMIWRCVKAPFLWLVSLFTYRVKR